MPRHIDACGIVEAAFESLRRFPGNSKVQASGLRLLWIHHGWLKGSALDSDRLGPDAVQAALHAMRMCCLEINSRGTVEGNVGASLADALHVALELLTSLNGTNASSWMLPLLDEPATAALLKCALCWLDLRHEHLSSPGMRAFVLRITQGACYGCGELQNEKMKRCARCGSAAYCSSACQHRHWPEHKRECKRQMTHAAAGARDAK